MSCGRSWYSSSTLAKTCFTCQTCNAYDLCHGGCMAVKHFTGRSLDAPDPDCVFGNDEPERARPAGDFIAIG